MSRQRKTPNPRYAVGCGASCAVLGDGLQLALGPAHLPPPALTRDGRTSFVTAPTPLWEVSAAWGLLFSRRHKRPLFPRRASITSYKEGGCVAKCPG